MAVFHVLVPAIFSALFSLSQATSVPSLIETGTSCVNQPNNGVICELQEMKLKIARLEATLGQTIENLNAKSLYLEDREKLIHEMGQKINDLHSALLGIKGDSSHADKRLNALEEEVRLLWAASRKNNFDFQVLESKAQDAEDRLEVLRSEVQKMTDIVTEQWIQIRHLEQALHGAEMRVLEVQRLAGLTRCTFLKFFGNIGNHLQKVIGMLESWLFGKRSTLNFYQSQALRQLRRIFSAAKKYHHKLQGYIKQEMERNEFMAAFANKELVFFMASLLIIFPIVCAWVLLSSPYG